MQPKSRAEKKLEAEFDLVRRIHEPEQLRVKSPPKPAHVFTVTLESSAFTEEKYALFEKYQRTVHKEPPHKISRKGFKSFLCETPLDSTNETSDPEKLLGTYHQCYRLDGDLVVVGVLDLLPQCVSAVYLMYDDSVAHFSFGKLSALREIALAREGGYRYWYAGFYIHQCPKMRYKADFKPQTLLDPTSYSWDSLNDELVEKLDKKKFVSLSLERAAIATKDDDSLDPEHTDEHLGKEEQGEKISGFPLPNQPSGPKQEAIHLPDEEDQSDNSTESDEASTLGDPSLTIFAESRSIPGLMTKRQILDTVDLDSIKVRVRGSNAKCADLMAWKESNMDSTRSIKGIIAELVSAVGADLAKDMVVVFD